MSVQFEEENNFNKAFSKEAKTSGGISSWLIQKGVVKDDAGAQKFLLIVAVVCFLLTLYFIFK